MRRLLLLGGVIGGLGLVRVAVRARCPAMMREMMERVMPRMMDRCFSRMSPEERAAMLSQCRAMLDRMAERYEIPIGSDWPAGLGTSASARSADYAGAADHRQGGAR